MSNKYVDLVEIIKQSRKNIRPALQGSIFERQSIDTDVLKGEESKIRALEEIKQRPDIKIVDEQVKGDIDRREDRERRTMEEEDVDVKGDEEVKGDEVEEEEEAKEDVMTEEEVRRMIEETTADISKLKPIHSKLDNLKLGNRYYRIVKKEDGQKKIVVFVKSTPKKSKPSVEDGVQLEIPLIKGRIPLDIEKDKLQKFASLVQKGEAKKKFMKRVKDFDYFLPLSGRGLDPRLLIGAYLAKNNNKQLENLVLNKLLGIN